MSNTYRSQDQKRAIVELLVRNGWTFTTESYTDFRGVRGWWRHSELQPFRAGDPKGFYDGAVTSFELYSGLSEEDAPKWNIYTQEFEWPVTVGA